MNLAIIGATGLVGEEILKVLKERNIFIANIFLVASDRSQGKKISFLKFPNAQYLISISHIKRITIYIVKYINSHFLVVYVDYIWFFRHFCWD